MGSTAIILAAGIGKRMQAGKNKQFILLDGKTVLERTLEVFGNNPLVEKIVLVVKSGEEETCRNLLKAEIAAKTLIVCGGKERQDSVYNGLKAITWQCDYILVHDGARPLVTNEVIERTFKAAQIHGAAVCAVAVKDTIKQADESGQVITTLPRASLWAVQTPQIFRAQKLISAYEYAYETGYYGTDDASLLEYAGQKVQIVMGDYENIKLTTPEDVELAERILAKRQKGAKEQCE